MRELNQQEVLEAILSCGLDLTGRISMTFEHGPDNVKRPTQVAERFARALQRKFMEVNGTTVDAAPAAQATDSNLQAFVSIDDVAAMELAAEEFDQNAEWFRSCGQDSMADSADARAHQLRAVRRRLYAPGPQAGEPLPPDEWNNEAALVMARFINLSVTPDAQSWAEAASRAIRLLNAPPTESAPAAHTPVLPLCWRSDPMLRPGEWDFHDWTMRRHDSENNQFCAFKAGAVAYIRKLDAAMKAASSNHGAAPG